MQFTLGRDKENNIVIDQNSVSKHHASINIEYYDDIEIEDLSSTNGTYINDRKIKKAKLHTGDQLRVGDYNLDMSVFLKNLFDLYKNKKTDFCKEYGEMLEIFKTYQQKKDKIINQPKGPLIIRVALTIFIIGILVLYPEMVPNDNIRFLLMGSIGLISVIMSLFGPSQSAKNQMLDKLRMEYEDRLVCPKCKVKLIQNNYSYYEGRKRCINEKCDASYV